MLTSKDYKMLASILAENLDKHEMGSSGSDCRYAIRCLRGDLIEWLKEDNPRFDEDRFIKAVENHHREED